MMKETKPPPKTKTFTCRCGKRCRWDRADYLDCIEDGVGPMCAKCDERRVMKANAEGGE